MPNSDADKALATQRLREQIVRKNVPKHPDYEQVVKDTLEFMGRTFVDESLRPEEVKALTQLRVANGNRDPQMVFFSEIADPEQLADALDQFPHFAGRIALKEGQELQPSPMTIE